MDNFYIMLEISATIVSIQKFFDCFTDTEKIGYVKDSGCKVDHFLEKINEILCSDQS